MIIDGMSMEMEMFLESFSRWSLFGKLLFAGSQKFFAILHYCFLWWIVKGICGFSGRSEQESQAKMEMTEIGDE